MAKALAVANGTSAGTEQSRGPVPSSGTCADSDHIHCVKVASLPADFCTTTGQSNWCASHVGEPWCICGWAYDNYANIHGKSLQVDCAGTAAHCRGGQFE